MSPPKPIGGDLVLHCDTVLSGTNVLHLPPPRTKLQQKKQRWNGSTPAKVRILFSPETPAFPRLPTFADSISRIIRLRAINFADFYARGSCGLLLKSHRDLTPPPRGLPETRSSAITFVFLCSIRYHKTLIVLLHPPGITPGGNFFIQV